SGRGVGAIAYRAERARLELPELLGVPAVALLTRHLGLSFGGGDKLWEQQHQRVAVVLFGEDLHRPDPVAVVTAVVLARRVDVAGRGVLAPVAPIAVSDHDAATTTARRFEGPNRDVIGEAHGCLCPSRAAPRGSGSWSLTLSWPARQTSPARLSTPVVAVVG